MVDLHKIVKAHLNAVRRDLDQVVERLSDADLRWRPALGMPTIADILLEILNKETETIGWIEAGVWPDDAADSFEAESALLEEIRVKMAAIRGDTFAYIDGKTEEELQRLVHNPNRWNEGFHLPECPLSEVLRFIASHEWYHTGQLVSYLWLRGDNPDQW
jgi:uncharacterized damage-inducible protein DinB